MIVYHKVCLMLTQLFLQPYLLCPNSGRLLAVVGGLRLGKSPVELPLLEAGPERDPEALLLVGVSKEAKPESESPPKLKGFQQIKAHLLLCISYTRSCKTHTSKLFWG
jgi:hypothetical protein